MARVLSVDSIRFIAILAVIAIHTSPFRFYGNDFSVFSNQINVLIDQLARFAVPFFFVISGYFYGLKLAQKSQVFATTFNSCKRILLVFLCWVLIYLLPYNFSSISQFGIFGPIKLSYWTLLSMLESPITTVFQGSKVHLWFLVSLVISMIISAIFIKFNKTQLLVIFALGIYLLGVCAKAYVATPIGLEIHFNTRNGPFFGLIFFVIGYLLSKQHPNARWFKVGLIFFALGMTLHLIEIQMLIWLYDSYPKQEYVFSTLLTGVGIAMIALSNHTMLCHKSAASFGKRTLGIYLSHYLFIDILNPIDKHIAHPLWELGYVPIVFALSLAFVCLLAKFKTTRFLVI